MYLTFRLSEKQQTVKRKEQRVAGQCPVSALMEHWPQLTGGEPSYQDLSGPPQCKLRSCQL